VSSSGATARRAFAVSAAAATLLGGVFATTGQARPQFAKQSGVTCAFGYGDRVLEVRAPEIVADGESSPGVAVITAANGVLTVRDAAGARIACAGFVPTLFATEEIVVKPALPFGSVALGLDLRRSELAPGATDEGDGSSEIEVSAPLGVNGELGIALGDGSDYLLGGRLSEPDAINLNADEARPDLDLVVNPEAQVRVSTGDGGGVASFDGGAGFSGPWSAPTTLGGGSGDDVLLGGASTDLIAGGGGADQMYGFGGHDLISAKGSGPDLIDCGARRDVVLASGRADSVRSCEIRRDTLSKRAAGLHALLGPDLRRDEDRALAGRIGLLAVLDDIHPERLLVLGRP
jgi:hypothetical protein